MNAITSPLVFFGVVVPVLELAIFSLVYFFAVPSRPVSRESSKPRTLTVVLEPRLPVHIMTPSSGMSPWVERETAPLRRVEPSLTFKVEGGTKMRSDLERMSSALLLLKMGTGPH